MCGIFFSIGFEGLPSEVIDSVVHRGPDGRGWKEFSAPQGHIVIAHRRLAIVDLSEDGHQPMTSDDQRYWVTYNGEIYNYIEIRDELKSHGYKFKTNSDTEVLLKSYIHWGERCLNKFNGMFAFVIWDNIDKKAFAARDRFGVKPLYYYKQGNKIAFASEIKQFKHIQNWRSILNESMAQFYKLNRYCDHLEETIYKNVYQVLPSNLVKIDSSDSIAFTKWYNLSDKIKPLNISDKTACDEFKSLFSEAIKIRLRSDVPVGACLSGGLDSSSIVSMMKNIKDDIDLHTFSAVFPGYKVDESKYIDELSSKKHFQNHKNYPSYEGFLSSLDQMLYNQDLPFSGSSIFAQWMTFKDAKDKKVTVLLDGQGADESLLGYPGMLNGVVFDYIKSMNFRDLGNFLTWQKEYNRQSYKTTLLLGVQIKFPSLYKKLLDIMGKNTDNDVNLEALRTIKDLCLKYFSHDLQTLLRYEDRNSMAFSTESRLPFLDYRLVEFILSLPISQRFRNEKTKWVLRESMRDINIDEILDRKDKIGFATPESEWSKNKELNNTTFHEFIFNRWMKNEGFC